MQSRLQLARYQHVRCLRMVSCKASVSFSVKKRVSYGDTLHVVGNHRSLGKWKPQKGAQLSWNEGDIWRGEMDIPENESLEFKLVRLKGQGDPQWESGYNRTLNVGREDLLVDMAWGNTENGSVSSITKGSTSNTTKEEGTGSVSMSEGSDKNVNVNEIATPPIPGTTAVDMLAHNTWQGKEIEFMRENNHSRDRTGAWDTDGLEGPTLQLVQGDKHAASWLQKLDVVKGVLVESSESMRPTLDALAPGYVYLQWIATGSIPCVEGGGHHRPNKHANLSKIMFRSLEWVAGDSSKMDIERWLARRMQAKLPSFSESFTASVPLTRIRDIAHRNDIPSDLKREIKHTLQNKLHRNAGPEDLVATEQMLQRITAPGSQFSEPFVREFKIFTEELRDFFNAGSLVTVLQTLTPSLDAPASAEVARFLDAKGSLDANQASSSIVECLHKLTSVRSQLVSGLATGLRNDAPDSALAMRQRWRLAELRCEDYAFILLSQYLNALIKEGGAAALASGRQDIWATPLGMLVLALRHLGLSGWQPLECFALDSDFATWQQLGATTSRDDTLRLKASLERTQRLTTNFVDGQLQALAKPANQLGGALAMPAEVQGVFTEAEIRASIAFQLSKLNSELLAACRAALGLGPYDSIVLGSATGELVEVPGIEPGLDLAGGRPCVLLVQAASGDEEISTAGSNIQGVMLCQELPHLSHLGVRARQERVPFATCTSPEAVKELKPLIGSKVVLDVTAEEVVLKAAGDAAVSAEAPAVPEPVAAPASGPVAAEGVDMVSKLVVQPVKAATQKSAGAKAAVCGQLAGMAEAGFSTPRGAILPFGCMEVILKKAGALKDFKKSVSVLEDAAVGSELDEACSNMQSLVQTACLPSNDLILALQKELDGANIVIARSSANVEDLAGLSGAGLYDSIPNLKLADEKSLADGLVRVWASLYSRRAVLSRRAAGVAQGEACMAILVQEMLAPDYSFVLHTKNPLAIGTDADDLYAEIAPGLGETLAAGTAGSAWRLTVNKSDDVTMHAFANFSKAYMPVSGSAEQVAVGSNIYRSSVDDELEMGMVAQKVIAYSKKSLSTQEETRLSLGKKLWRVGKLLELELGGPQDVEGALVGDVLYIVQSRPQP